MPKSIVFTLILICFACPPVFAQKTIRTTQQLVVIDPGHGGAKAGLSSAAGSYEKDITLTLAKITAEKLDPFYNVILTRDKDIDLSPEQRVSFANHKKAALYISLHLAQTADYSGSFHFYRPEGQSGNKAFGPDTWAGAPIVHTSSSKLAAECFLQIFSAKNKKQVYLLSPTPTILLKGTRMPAVLIEPFSISQVPEDKGSRPDLFETYAGLIVKSVHLYFKKSKPNK